MAGPLWQIVTNHNDLRRYIFLLALTNEAAQRPVRKKR